MWYVIQVCTGKEAEIVSQCREKVVKQGEDVFVPLAERQTKFHGERVLVTSRLFPGYVFIETRKIDDFYFRLKQAKVTAKVLKVGDDIVPIYPEEEAYLKKIGGREHIARYSEGYLENGELTVISGALKGYKGKVKKILRHKRLVVLEFSLCGKKVSATFGLGIVEKRQKPLQMQQEQL